MPLGGTGVVSIHRGSFERKHDLAQWQAPRKSWPYRLPSSKSTSWASTSKPPKRSGMGISESLGHHANAVLQITVRHRDRLFVQDQIHDVRSRIMHLFDDKTCRHPARQRCR